MAHLIRKASSPECCSELFPFGIAQCFVWFMWMRSSLATMRASHPGVKHSRKGREKGINKRFSSANDGGWFKEVYSISSSFPQQIHPEVYRPAFLECLLLILRVTGFINVTNKIIQYLCRSSRGEFFRFFLCRIFGIPFIEILLGCESITSLGTKERNLKCRNDSFRCFDAS